MLLLLKTLQCTSFLAVQGPVYLCTSTACRLPPFIKFKLQVSFTLSFWPFCVFLPPAWNPPSLLFLSSWFSFLRIQLKCDPLRKIFPYHCIKQFFSIFHYFLSHDSYLLSLYYFTFGNYLIICVFTSLLSVFFLPQSDSKLMGKILFHLPLYSQCFSQHLTN